MLEQIGGVLQGDVGQSLAPGIRELAATTDLASVKAGIKFIDMLDLLDREGIVDAKSWELASRLYSTQAYKTATREEMCDVKEAHPQASVEQTLLAHAISHDRGYPIALDCTASRRASNTKIFTEHLIALLAQCAICELSLPGINAGEVDDLLSARIALKDELIEFRAGIRSLTELLHQQVKGKHDFQEIREEAEVLVNTKIRGALMSLENRMRRHKDKRIRRILVRGGRVLGEAAKLFLPGGWSEKLVAGGKSLVQLATEIDNAKPPEDQVATYLYKVRSKFT